MYCIKISNYFWGLYSSGDSIRVGTLLTTLRYTISIIFKNTNLGIILGILLLIVVVDALLLFWVKLELRRPKLFKLVVDDRLLGEAESDLQKVKMRLEALLAIQDFKNSTFIKDYRKIFHYNRTMQFM